MRDISKLLIQLKQFQLKFSLEAEEKNHSQELRLDLETTIHAGVNAPSFLRSLTLPHRSHAQLRSASPHYTR